MILAWKSYLRQTPGCSLGWHLIFVARHASHAVEILLRAGHASIGDDSLVICIVLIAQELYQVGSLDSSLKLLCEKKGEQ